MSTPETSRFVRLSVELVLEIEDEDAVIGAARSRIAEHIEDGELDPAERAHAEGAVTEDTAEALAYLVDPFDLVGEVPGVELQQASWSSEPIAYDPDSPDWEFGEDDVDEEVEEVEENGEGDEDEEGGDDQKAGGAGHSG
ncbi:hypothetical protein ACFY3J_07350 [Streptomyces sp. NPDC001231]|uniref:hypothetical protein n=1 Tax=unclassified Streptomyces TaxID=2593676 RepID=UPI0036986648